MGPKVKNEDIRKEEVIQAVIIDDCLNPEFLLDKKTNTQKLQQVNNGIEKQSSVMYIYVMYIYYV
jgi:hypothetical protein